MAFSSGRQLLILTISSTNWMKRIPKNSCVHVNISSEILKDPILERTSNKIFNYAVEKFSAIIVDSKLHHFFNSLKCAGKRTLIFGFILRNIDTGGFRYFYAHKNNTMLDRSKLISTKDGLAELKYFLSN